MQKSPPLRSIFTKSPDFTSIVLCKTTSFDFGDRVHPGKDIHPTFISAERKNCAGEEEDIQRLRVRHSSQIFEVRAFASRCCQLHYYPEMDCELATQYFWRLSKEANMFSAFRSRYYTPSSTIHYQSPQSRIFPALSQPEATVGSYKMVSLLAPSSILKFLSRFLTSFKLINWALSLHMQHRKYLAMHRPSCRQRGLSSPSESISLLHPVWTTRNYFCLVFV